MKDVFAMRKKSRALELSLQLARTVLCVVDVCAPVNMVVTT